VKLGNAAADVVEKYYSGNAMIERGFILRKIIVNKW